MILLTGGAGFIGSNILAALNDRGRDDVIVVDDLADGGKCRNLAGLRFADYLDVTELSDAVRDETLPRLSAICHQGGCTDSTITDGRVTMRDNFTFSKTMLRLAGRHRCPLVYASSASVYGDGRNGFRESAECERPLSPYAFSKWAFDQHLRWLERSGPGVPPPSVTGLRYFNVYGPGEEHKGPMASVAWQCFEALYRGESPRVFAESDCILRDFIHVGDVVAVNLHFLENRPAGLRIVNVGSGVARSFLDLASCASRVAGGLAPVTVPFPERLRGQYQRYTCADLGGLRAAGYAAAMTPLETGIAAYHAALSASRRSAARCQG